VKEYDIFLPLRYNDGTPIELIKFQDLQAQLLANFAGLTYFPQANQGFWKLGEVTYRDEIVIYRVLASDSRRARSCLRSLKEELLATFAQEAILIVERDVNTL
jgi:hypothetical protein